MMRCLLFFAFILQIMVFASCDRYEVSELQPEYALPLANSRLGVYDLLSKDSSNLISSDDGLIVLTYRDSLPPYTSEQLLRLSNQDTTVAVKYPGPARNPFPTGNIQSYSGTFNVTYHSSEDELLYKINFRHGTVNLRTETEINNRLAVKITIPELKILNSPLVLHDTIEPGETGFTSSIISGYALDLRRSTRGSNQFAVNYEITVISTGNPLNTGQNTSFGIEFTRQIYEEVECYIGRKELTFAEDSVVIKLFQFTDEDRPAADFALTDPKLRLIFENSFTIPMQGEITRLCTKEIKSREEENLLGGFNNPFNIRYPLTPGILETTVVELNKDNSNIEEVLTPEEKTLRYAARVITNPNESGINKISRNSQLSTKVEISIPLTGYGSNWILSDTIDLGISFTAEQKENVEKFILHLNLYNRFPFESALQIYFLDENNQVFDTLLQSENGFLQSGVVDQNGKVIDGRNTITDIDLSPGRTEALFKAKSIVVNAVLSTVGAAGQREISIYEDYFIDIKLGIRTRLKINPDL